MASDEFIEIPGPAGTPVQMRQLFKEQTPQRELCVVADMAGMHVYVRLVPGPEFAGADAAEMEAVLQRAGVVIGINQQSIALVAERASSGRPLTEYVQVARGEPMRKGEDGSIEFHVRPAEDMNVYEEGASAHGILENCFAGQRVATILPPGIGRAGRDVFGNVIDPQPGDQLTIQPGKGIKISPNGKEFSAESDGRLVFENNRLSVSTVLEIPCDVDATVGSINFVGRVVINGSVADGMEVDGRGGVTVGGDMGAAVIISNGDVKINGAVNGGGTATITCRNLYARSIEGATVDATGNVLSASSIKNAQIHSKGQVSVLNGGIVSGTVCALGGVAADVIGSLGGDALTILAGMDWDEEIRKEDMQDRINGFLHRIEDANKMLEPLFAAGDLAGKLEQHQKTMISELITELRFVREDLTRLLEERAELSAIDRKGAGARISARSVLNSGVLIRFPGFETQVPKLVQGPLEAVPDPTRGLRLERPHTSKGRA